MTSKDRSDQQVTDAVSWLIANGLLPQEKHARAVAMAQHSSERMDQLLLKLGLVNEQHLAQALSVACDLPLVAREAFPADAPFNGLLQTDYLRAQPIAPLPLCPLNPSDPAHQITSLKSSGAPLQQKNKEQRTSRSLK